MRRIRIAQIGIGHDHAASTFSCLCRQTEFFDVVGWCPVPEDAGYPVHPCYTGKPRLSLRDLFAIPGLDAVTVETDDLYLTKYAQEAAEHRLAVHMDKPGSPSAEDFEKLARTVKQADGVLQLGYMYRYNPMIRSVVDAARAGEYGEISAVEAHMDCEHTPEKRQWLARFRGGMLYFLGCHLIDLVLQINGLPEEILPLSCRSGFGGVTGEDIGMAVFRYRNGVSFVRTSGVEPGGFMRRQLTVVGRNRSVELRPLEEYLPDAPGLQVTRMRDCVSGKDWSFDGVHTVSEPMDRYDAMFADFAAMARGEKKNPYTPEYECLLHRVILAACGYDIDYRAPISI